MFLFEFSSCSFVVRVCVFRLPAFVVRCFHVCLLRVFNVVVRVVVFLVVFVVVVVLQCRGC